MPSPANRPHRDRLTPKAVDMLREGYGAGRLSQDATAGLTVAIVALPLSMAIAIASGVSPERGLATAIVGGFLVSLLGGSRHQIGGPAGAFIVLVAAVVERHGLDGFLLATMLAGCILVTAGLLRLGVYVRYIPHPVIVGFTSGIAVIILASQLRDFLGLALPGREPGALVPKLEALIAARSSLTPAALALSLACVAAILALRRYRPRWPAFLIVVAGAALAAGVVGLPVETIGTRFGGVPSSLPAPSLPEVSLARILQVLPDALAIALLAGVESLLSAVVADAMTGRRHRPNAELVAQGVANVASPLFGGLAVTGTIARTATNIRAGGTGPVSGMLHAAFLLGFMLLAAPLASHIPLAALAAVLVVVSWTMAERHEFAAIIARRQGEALVLLATFGLTVFRGLLEGIVVGVVLSSFIFMHRMAATVAVEQGLALDPGEEDDAPESGDDVLVCRIAGPLFFGAAGTVAAALEEIGRFPRAVILDLSSVPFADASAADAVGEFAGRARRQGAEVFVAGAARPVREALLREGVQGIRFAPSVADARMAARHGAGP